MDCRSTTRPEWIVGVRNHGPPGKATCRWLQLLHHSALRLPEGGRCRHGLQNPYRNDGHDERPQVDDLSEWHPAFLQLAPMPVGCARRQVQCCHGMAPVTAAGGEVQGCQWGQGQPLGREVIIAITCGLIDGQRWLKPPAGWGFKGPSAQGQSASASHRRCRVADQRLSLLEAALVLPLMRFLSWRLKPKAAKAPSAGRGPGAEVAGDV